MARHRSSLFAFVLGTLVGAVVGVLYAPEEGKNTRDKLSYKLKNYRTTLHDFVQDLSKGKVPFENSAKQAGDKVMKSAKMKAEKLLNDVDSLLSKLQND